MKHLIARSVLLASISLYALHSYAGQATVELQAPEKFTDIRAPNMANEKAYHASVLKALMESANSAAKRLPENYALQIEVTDMDLAGDVEPLYLSSGFQQMRIMEDNDFPQITFNYKVTDGAGAVVSEGIGIKLKDMGYLHNTHSVNANDPFYHEQRLVKKWMNDELIAKLN